MRQHGAALSIVLCTLFAVSSPPASAAVSTLCRRSDSLTISGAQFMAHYNRYVGHCLHLRGLIAARAYFPSVVALYRSRRRAAATYSASDEIGDELWSKRSMVDLVARVTTCARIWSSAEAEAEETNRKAKATGSTIVSIPFISGLCHYSDGPALLVSLIKWREAEPTRLTTKADRARYGNIVPVEPSASGMDVVVAVTEGWFAEHRSDRTADLGWLPPAPLSIAYFREKNWEDRAADTILSVGCVCRTADCNAEWPIHTADTWNHDKWPYYCIEIEDGVVR